MSCQRGFTHTQKHTKTTTTKNIHRLTNAQTHTHRQKIIADNPLLPCSSFSCFFSFHFSSTFPSPFFLPLTGSCRSSRQNNPGYTTTTVWCGVVWCGVVWWCGVMCGVVWCGVMCVQITTVVIASPREVVSGLGCNACGDSVRDLLVE